MMQVMSPLCRPVIVRDGPQPRLLIAIVLAHGAALAATLLAGLSWPVRVCILFQLGLGMLLQCRRFLHGLRSPPPVYVLTSDDRWILYREDAPPLNVEVIAPCCVWSWLVVIRFRAADGSRFGLVSLGTHMTAAEFRRLRVRLRMPAASQAVP